MPGLREHLARAIAQQGPISIAQYMTEALTHPVHGYYMHRDPFGAAGDFITAPEISQMFGELIGLWCADQWQRMGAPPKISLVELGPGRGTLMADALRALKAAPAARAALQPVLIEVSLQLRRQQQEKLRDAQVLWCDSIAEIPSGPAIFIANEFFDAMPIRQFVKTADGWHERLVDMDGDSKLRFVLSPRAVAAEAWLPIAMHGAATGSIAECSTPSLAIASEIAAWLVAQSGAALIIDYGPAQSGIGDTFQALRQHRPEDVLLNPGHADLTAHVDFASLADAARAAGAASFGPVTQGQWLTRLGLAERSRSLQSKAAPAQAKAVAEAADRLTGPEAMGTLFKVLALTDPALAKAGPPAGFM